MARPSRKPEQPPQDDESTLRQAHPHPSPLPNYALSSVCPACNTPTYRLACKVRCPRCGFMWDCSEL